MTEHHWPDEHHDDGADLDHHDEVEQPDLDAGLPDDDHWDTPDDPLPVEHHDVEVPYEHHVDEPVAEDHPDVLVDTDPHEMATVGADPDALPDTDDPVGVFPPVVDVGPLPEPIDGHPWIDTGSLGLVDPATVHAAAAAAPDPGELAEYAAEDLPPGADPWAALADSEDPATSALARFWSSPAGPDQP